MHVQVHANLVVIHAFVLINASVNITSWEKWVYYANYEINSTTHHLPWLEIFWNWAINSKGGSSNFCLDYYLWPCISANCNFDSGPLYKNGGRKMRDMVRRSGAWWWLVVGLGGGMEMDDTLCLGFYLSHTHPRRWGACMKRRGARTAHVLPSLSQPHPHGYTVELNSVWKGSPRGNLTHVLAVHLMEGGSSTTGEQTNCDLMRYVKKEANHVGLP